MSSKDLEKQIEELERILRATDGTSYSLVSVTVGVQAKRPSDAICKEWLSECKVITEDLISTVNRFSSTVPLVVFAGNRMPPNDWMLVKGLPSLAGNAINGGHRWWVHQILSQRYKQWAKTN